MEATNSSSKRPHSSDENPTVMPSNTQLFDQLVRWVVASGGSVNDVEVVEDSSLGFHVRSIKELLPGHILFEVPPALMITWANVTSSPLIQAFVEGGVVCSDHGSAIEAEHERLVSMDGPSLLNDILQSRERALCDLDETDSSRLEISDRGLLLAYLAHARFGTDGLPLHAPTVRSFPSSFTLPLLWPDRDLHLLSNCLLGIPALRSVPPSPCTSVHVTSP